MNEWYDKKNKRCFHICILVNIKIEIACKATKRIKSHQMLCKEKKNGESILAGLEPAIS